MMEYLKNIGNVAPVLEINGSNVAGGSNPGGVVYSATTQETAAQTSAVDGFYEKLSKLFESSGLSLLFNFRETSLDLYVFYKEVTARGGFCMVSKEGKWAEVASTLNSKSLVSMSPVQLQKLYAHFLYQFEQTYHYRTPAHVAGSSGHSSGSGGNSISSTRKRNQGSISPFLTSDLFKEDGPATKKKCGDNSNQLSTGPPKKDKKKDPNAPLRTRSSYQLFLRKECDRLKKIHGETSASQNTRNMAIDAWRHLSESGRQPYVEDSMKDKERFSREMTAYKDQKDMPGKKDGDYCVNVQLAPGNFSIPDESAAELASQLKKNEQPNESTAELTSRLMKNGQPNETAAELTSRLMKKGQPNETAAELTSRLMKKGQPNETAAELTSRLMKNGQPNETSADLACLLMKNGQPTDDAFFQINWDSYCGSLDMPV